MMEFLLLDEITGTYSSDDWNHLSKDWKLTTYLTIPGTDEPLDQSSVTYHSPVESSSGRSFDEVMEEVLEDRAEAWERLADL